MGDKRIQDDYCETQICRFTRIHTNIGTSCSKQISKETGVNDSTEIHKSEEYEVDVIIWQL